MQLSDALNPRLPYPLKPNPVADQEASAFGACTERVCE